MDGIKLGHQTRVYKNLNNGKLSIQQQIYIDGKGMQWRVVGHAEEVRLRGCTFKVYEAGRQRVLKEHRKNVHAYVRGTLVSVSDVETFDKHDVGAPIYYNPYECTQFKNLSTGGCIERAMRAKITAKGGIRAS